jgi:tetratricopeptide (TPR) repeat protein
MSGQVGRWLEKGLVRDAFAGNGRVVDNALRVRRWTVSALTCVPVSSRSLAVANIGLWLCARLATAAPPHSDESEARRALTEANAALAAGPAGSADARRALDRAVAADADPLAAAEAHFRLGVLDEADGAFARALTNYTACLGSMPTSRWARNARQRIAWLDERSEGEFKPLARLQRVRRDPSLANDAAEIEALASAAETFPTGVVRGEARMFVAETWLKGMNRPKDAVTELRKVLDDPHTDRRTAVFAERDLVGFWLGDDKLDEAASELQRYHFDRQSETEVEALLHKRALHRGEVFAMCAVGVLFVFTRRRRRAV